MSEERAPYDEEVKMADDNGITWVRKGDTELSVEGGVSLPDGGCQIHVRQAGSRGNSVAG